MPITNTLLVADNDPTVREILATRFTSLGYDVAEYQNGEDVLLHYNQLQPKIMILEIYLPNIDGYEVCRQIRATSSVPVIFLSSVKTKVNKNLGLLLGGEDVLFKPFSLKELECRVHNLLVRINLQFSFRIASRTTTFQFGELFIDFKLKQVNRDKKTLPLTEMEFKLFEFLFKNRNIILTRTVILDNIWGYTPQRANDTRTVDVYISRLRLKLEENPKNPKLIITIRGIGYMFQSSLKPYNVF